MTMAVTLRRYALPLTLLVLAAVLIAGFAFMRLKPIDVTVIGPEQDVPVEVFGLGTVEARTISQLGFEVSGTLVALEADFGDKVVKGQVLAELQSSEQSARVTSMKAAAAQARAAAAQARATVGRSQVAMRQKQAISERRDELARRGTASSEATEEARAVFEIALADVALAESAVDVADENVRQAEALLAVEEARLAKYTLAAPFDGLIVARQGELGSILNPGETLFTVADPASIWVLAYVDESKSGRIETGQPARVTLRSQPGLVHPARVARIDIESDRVNEERRVYVKCEECPGTFHLGEQAEVVITVATLADALLVPLSAITDLTHDRGRVWTLQDGRLAEATLRFGLRTLDGRVEVVDGLPEGARIVVAPTTGLTAGRAAKAAQVPAR